MALRTILGRLAAWLPAIPGLLALAWIGLHHSPARELRAEAALLEAELDSLADVQELSATLEDAKLRLTNQVNLVRTNRRVVAPQLWLDEIFRRLPADVHVAASSFDRETWSVRLELSAPEEAVARRAADALRASKLVGRVGLEPGSMAPAWTLRVELVGNPP